MIRLEVADYLVEYGRPDEGINILASLVDPRIGELNLDNVFWRIDELSEWTALSHAIYAAMERLVREFDVSSYQIEEMVRMLASWKTEMSLNVLRAIASDDRINDWHRCDATGALATVLGPDRGSIFFARLAWKLEDSYARHYAESEAARLDRNASQLS
jgi:hypothetical protein